MSHELRTRFIQTIFEKNNIPETFLGSKGKKQRTITGHHEGLRFASPNRIKFEHASGINDLLSLTETLEPLGITNIQSTKASGGKIDNNNGFLVEWENEKFVILLKGMVDQTQVRRKQTTPADLGLADGYYQSTKDLVESVLQGIENSPLNLTVQDTLKDLVQSVVNDRKFSVNETLTSSNFIQSDFGEVLAAVYRAMKNDVIKFPSGANNDGSDFFGNDIGYSVKAPNGDHVNLRSYKDKIKGSTPIDLFFRACATSDFELLFRSLSTDQGICQDLYQWVSSTSGENTVTMDGIRKFMQLVSYDTFLDWLKIKQSGKNTLGLPSSKKMHIAQNLWQQQNHNPFFFSYITLAQRIWGNEHADEISRFAREILKQDQSVFITVNIDLEQRKVDFKEQSFKDVDSWKIWYLGYCDQAVKNWPAICRDLKK